MTADEFRELALAIPGAVEASHMDHPDFRFDGKIFASLGAPDEEWGMVKLTPDQQRSFLKQAPKMFKQCNGAWGRQGCTNVLLAAAKETLVRSALIWAAKNLEGHAPKRKKQS
jgi:hypothetical protein